MGQRGLQRGQVEVSYVVTEERETKGVCQARPGVEQRRDRRERKRGSRTAKPKPDGKAEWALPYACSESMLEE